MTDVGDGEVSPGRTLIERYDYLAALLVQIHRHAAVGLAQGDYEATLRMILAEATLPCPARVSVMRATNALIALKS